MKVTFLFVCSYSRSLLCLRLFFFLLISLSHQTLRSLLLPGNKPDRLETLTQCRMVVIRCRLLFRQSDIWRTLLGKLAYVIKRLSKRPPIAQSIYTFVAASPWRYDVTPRTFAAVQTMMCVFFGAAISAPATQTEFLFIFIRNSRIYFCLSVYISTRCSNHRVSKKFPPVNSL